MFLLIDVVFGVEVIDRADVFSNNKISLINLFSPL